MSGPDGGAGAERPPRQHRPGAEPGSGGAEAARRRRLDEVFGDVLPDTTADERGGSADDRESWYRENRPPHHGG